MKFDNKDLLITDPCYLIKDNGDWMKFINSRTNLSRKYDSTIVGMVGECTDTGYGDWICHLYCTKKENVEEHLKKVMKKQVIPREDHSLGTFSADAGMVCIVNLTDSSQKIKDAAQELLKKSPWCAVLIENYSGEVNLIKGQDSYTHIVGDGIYSILG
jgi:hypothetical protein